MRALSFRELRFANRRRPSQVPPHPTLARRVCLLERVVQESAEPNVVTCDDIRTDDQGPTRHDLFVRSSRLIFAHLHLGLGSKGGTDEGVPLDRCGGRRCSVRRVR